MFVVGINLIYGHSRLFSLILNDGIEPCQVRPSVSVTWTMGVPKGPGRIGWGRRPELGYFTMACAPCYRLCLRLLAPTFHSVSFPLHVRKEGGKAKSCRDGLGWTSPTPFAPDRHRSCPATTVVSVTLVILVESGHALLMPGVHSNRELLPCTVKLESTPYMLTCSLHTR
jgi:hypothetical protein